MTAAGDDRTVRQLNNDLTAIHAYLSAIATMQDRHGTLLDQLAGVLAQHTATLAALVGMQAQQTATLAEHADKLDRIIEIVEGR
jgi:hypothetical protein